MSLTMPAAPESQEGRGAERMGKRTRPKRSDTFESEVQRQFGQLAARWGLDGPVDAGVILPVVAYHGDRLTYRWMLDDEDRALTVTVHLVVTEGTLAIAVDDLVPGAGLGAHQQVRTSARTWHSLQQSIASHLHWLEQLHPLLTGPGAKRLLERAGARKITPDLD
jgi:hypothetical protein